MSSYDLSVVNTPVTYSWTGPTGVDLVSNNITLISSGSSGSTLTLTPVDQPSVSSGNYTCSVTAQSESTLIQSGTGSDSVALDVLGECVVRFECMCGVCVGRSVDLRSACMEECIWIKCI